MRHITVVALGIILLVAGPVMAQVSAPQLWKARGLEAHDKIKTFETKIERLSKSWESPEANALKCEGMLEFAFAMHLADEAMVHKVLKDGRHVFKIVLNGGDQGFFDLSYVYEPQTWRLVAVTVFSLPKDWNLMFPPAGDKGGAMLLDLGDASMTTCLIGFSLSQPFWARVVPASSPAKPEQRPQRRERR
jgi:hypothetical protein